ncbi:unnamed protein product [Peniophora sp. CBMAI 1063]|nr:unnamed protein product [Peniophora sp. CBMAI 1063]
MVHANAEARDTEFYITDELYVIQVEGTKFRVHKKLLSDQSGRFADMFAIPTPDNGAGCGLSDADPIILNDVDVKDFKAFLSVIYNSARPNFAMSAADWLRVLCVAHRYDCGGIHTRALDGIRTSRLQPGQDTDALACAEQHNIDVRLIDDSALKYAITRLDALSATETANLTPGMASKLCAAREKWAVDSALHKNAPDLGSETASQGKPCSKCKARYYAAPNIQRIIATIWGRKEKAEDLAGVAFFSEP